MCSLGLKPDPWQLEVLEADHPRLLLNCCRQAGKSTFVALLGLAEAVYERRGKRRPGRAWRLRNPQDRPSSRSSSSTCS
jgi:hypothetical protein